MRHVRMLGLCLATLFALSAMTAGQALAKEKCQLYGETCETVKEHSAWQAFANCPLEEELDACVAGKSYYKETFKTKQDQEEYLTNHPEYHGGQVSYFTAGNVTVPLKNSISLRGGFISGEESGVQDWVAAVGAATIEPVPQPSVSLKKGVNAALLSQSELERYDYYVHIGKETKTYATVELAGPVSNLHINLNHILEEQGQAFVFPVKVKLSNPFLGEHCYVGSDASPIKVPFTTGTAGELRGKFGEFITEASSDILVDWGQTLVSNEFASPGVEGCGVDGGADEAVDSALGLPAPTGNKSVLNGVLKLAGEETTTRALKGEI